MEAKETVKAILKKADKCAGDLANETEGNFKPEDMEAIWFDGYMEIYKAGILEVVDELARSKVYLIGTEETKYVYWLVDEAKLKEWGIGG